MKYIAIMILMVSSVVEASSISNTKITQIMVDRTLKDWVLIKVDKEHVGKKGCHTSEWDYMLLVNDDHSRQLFSMLLAARMADKSVTLIGANDNCSIKSDSETLNRVYL